MQCRATHLLDRSLPCVAGGIVGALNKVLAVESLKARGEGNREEDFEIQIPHENYGFLNSPHTSVRENRIGREKKTRQSNVR